MIGRCQFRSALSAFDDVLNIEPLHARKGFEQFHRQLRQLTRPVALEMISSVDIRVRSTLVFLVSVLFVLVPSVTIRLFLFMAVIIRVLSRMFTALLVQQCRVDLRFFHSTLCLRIESKQPITVFQGGDRLVQRGMVGLR